MDMDWSDIEKSLKTLSKVDGGFSSARRGIVTLPDSLQVFVKIGVDDATKRWAKKEVEVYRSLQRQSYLSFPNSWPTITTKQALPLRNSRSKTTGIGQMMDGRAVR